MAIETKDKKDEMLFVLEGAGVDFKVKAPSFFYELLRQTLKGWCFSPWFDYNSVEVNVTLENECFNITTHLARTVPLRSDLIDALNEFFLCLAYLLTSKKNGAHLLHCAAFEESGVYSVVFGKKKAGKSSLVFQKAKDGATILADDVMIWLPKSAEVICIGLPLRLRRPVVGIPDNDCGRPQFFAGKQTAYAQKDVFRIAEAGKSFTPDRIYRLIDQKLAPVSLIRWPKVIAEHTISDQFTRLKHQ